MPLLGKRPWVPNPPLKDLTHTDEVWVVRFTDEAFRSYEEYLERWEHYRQRVWTCRYTGRSGLTYEEALFSEADATHLSLQIPEEQLIEIGLQIHKFIGGLEAMVEHVQKHFREAYAAAKGDKAKQKPVPTKAVIRQVVKLIADKDGYKGAPWMLKKEFCAKHNLTVSRDLPQALKEAKEKYDERHKRDREEDEEGEDEKDEESESETSPKKKCRIIEYQKDDLDLKGADAQPPAPAYDFAVENHAVGDMLMAFTFCISYRQKLGIQRIFTLGDFENLLLSEDHSDLMDEIIVRLLKSVFHGDPTSGRVTAATYNIVLRKWLKTLHLIDGAIKLDLSSISDLLQDCSFSGLTPDTKVAIFALLTRAVLDSTAIRQHLDESYETSLELQKEEKVQEEEEKQRDRITAAFERKKKQTELNLEKMVAKLRAVSLGYDRNYRRYWFWPAAGPRLWIETPPTTFYNSVGVPRPPTADTDPSIPEENGIEIGNQKEKKEEKGKTVQKAEDDETEEQEGSTSDVKENGVAHNDEKPADVSTWAYYDSIEQVDDLIQFLNDEGPREKELKANLERKYQKICDAMKRPYYSTHAHQRVVIVPQYDMPVRRSSRLADRTSNERTSSRRPRR